MKKMIRLLGILGTAILLSCLLFAVTAIADSEISNDEETYANDNDITVVLSDFVKSSDEWIYYVDGKQSDCTGLVKGTISDISSSAKWYYVKNGVYTKATGITKKANDSSSAWYFVKNGKYTKATGIARKTDGSSSNWYFVKNGKYTKATGIARKADGSSSNWFFVKKGKYTKATGITRKADGSSTVWYYVKNGTYKTNVRTVAKKADGSSSALFFVKNSKFYKYTGIVKVGSKSYYLFNGKVATDNTLYGVSSIKELGQVFGASVGKVSLDQQMLETVMGKLGKQRIEAEGNLTDYQKNILWSCRVTSATPAHYCALWITNVFENIGIYTVYGNANDMWANICYSSNLDDLQPGMLIAVQHSRTDTDSDGYIYGHVGIYIGMGYVIASTTVSGEGRKVITSLDDWLSRYDPYGTAAWGYPS